MTFLPDGAAVSEIDRNTVKDPFFYGFRYESKVGADGKKGLTQAPLTEWDVLHPKEGDHVATNRPHTEDRMYLKTAFDQILKGRSDALVLSDHLIDWQMARISPHSPDVIVLRVEELQAEIRRLKGE
jgi:hypothetical protein